VLALLGGWASLRWSVAGIALSGLALTVSFAIAQAPAGYLPSRVIPLDTQPVPDRLYVPPPARPGNVSGVILPTTVTEKERFLALRPWNVSQWFGTMTLRAGEIRASIPGFFKE
jgi:hypothetical protein